MLPFLHRDEPCLGAVFFESAAPPPAEAFGFVRAAGYEIVERQAPPDAIWALELRHPEHGSARLICQRGAPPVAHFLQFGLGLTQGEVDRAAGAQSAVLVAVPAEFKHVLRDRKRLLRAMRAIMADDAVLAVDLASEMPWSRAALDAELAHDADLDVEALYVYHAVQEPDGSVNWLHTHGLGELGGFDFDIVDPSAYTVENANDVFRALTFDMLAGRAQESTQALPLAAPNGVVRLVPARQFMKEADPKHRAPREMGGGDPHDVRRAIVCEPARRGLVRSSGRPEPSQLLSATQDGAMLFFTDEAGEVMAERARGTLPTLSATMDELAGFPAQALVKLGFPTASREGREHLWFELHGVGPAGIDCTLVNDPLDVPSLRSGQRGEYPTEMLTDWIVLTPAGSISPRSTLALRTIRELPDAAKRALREAAASDPH